MFKRYTLISISLIKENVDDVIVNIFHLFDNFQPFADYVVVSLKPILCFFEYS